MKKPILILLMAFGMNVAAQTDFTNKVYKGSIEIKDGVERYVEFDLITTKKMLMLSNPYQRYKAERIHLIEGVSENSLMERFVKFSIEILIIRGKAKMPYPETFELAEEKGMFAIDPKDNEIIAKIPFIANNEKGKLSAGYIYQMSNETYVSFKD
jgi:hypothetical protein